MEDPEQITCPFCGFRAEGDYQIMLHMETLHPENGESPFVAKENASIAALVSLQDEEDVQYVNCPVDGCGEALLLTELDNHIEMHEEEQSHSPGESDESSRSPKRLKIEPRVEASFDTKLSYALRNLDEDDGHLAHEKSSHDVQTAAKNTWKSILKMPDSASKAESKVVPIANSSKKRLGKSEIGPHAHEKQMPAWLVKLLEEDGALKMGNRLDSGGKIRRVQYSPNQTAGIVPVLAQLLEQNETTSYAYLCDPAVKHVSKLRREGGFCGYRNIQVLCSYIIGTRSQGHDSFGDKVPTIFDIQEYIESAWDIGINSQGRIETGGIRGTRKYIGTPDAQAMFCVLGIACSAQAFKPKKGSNSQPGSELLFTAIENYFINGCTDYDPKVRRTSLPPIYFQHPGHSMTIVGFEKQKDGSRNIIVFDPMFHDAADVTKLIGTEFTHRYPGDLLKAYRRGVKYLRRYGEFEILKLTPPKNQQSGEERG
ncbi:DUF1671-domain-containing protein [Mollisia scopiformis]|uniref:DUF1671-domain-containing protein n=1 Tax=Mollisia scopiformis TaxID=149040 RepID=A0A194XK80_MOLSC|nr:DUF1671-domain-containing protein [Mollisia scopiformis]KUJ20197.1 DUF1671-domain-containing protein [Mollisia scopiformis]